MYRFVLVHCGRVERFNYYYVYVAYRVHLKLPLIEIIVYIM